MGIEDSSLRFPCRVLEKPAFLILLAVFRDCEGAHLPRYLKLQRTAGYSFEYSPPPPSWVLALPQASSLAPAHMVAWLCQLGPEQSCL